MYYLHEWIIWYTKNVTIKLNFYVMLRHNFIGNTDIVSLSTLFSQKNLVHHEFVRMSVGSTSRSQSQMQPVGRRLPTWAMLCSGLSIQHSAHLFEIHCTHTDLNSRHFHPLHWQFLIFPIFFVIPLQCFDTVGWVTGRASGL